MIVPCWKDQGYSKSLACCFNFFMAENKQFMDRSLRLGLYEWMDRMAEGRTWLILGGILSVL